jgi:hypothetical protein
LPDQGLSVFTPDLKHVAMDGFATIE